MFHTVACPAVQDSGSATTRTSDKTDIFYRNKKKSPCRRGGDSLFIVCLYSPYYSKPNNIFPIFRIIQYVLYSPLMKLIEKIPFVLGNSLPIIRSLFVNLLPIWNNVSVAIVFLFHIFFYHD